MVILEVRNVSKKFGGLTAVNNVSLSITEGEIVGLIGPNGAGKTTLFSCISGYYKPDVGEVLFYGKPITGLRPNRVCKIGLTRTFQIVKTIERLSVLENVMIGVFLRDKNITSAREKAIEIVRFCGLDDVVKLRGGSLPIAYKKRIEVARALATNPKLMLLDEVMAGLTPKEGQDAIILIRKIRDIGTTILMVEHVMEIIMPISDRLVVLDSGIKIAEGIPSEIANNERVIEAYLGVKP